MFCSLEGRRWSFRVKPAAAVGFFVLFVTSQRADGHNLLLKHAFYKKLSKQTKLKVPFPE